MATLPESIDYTDKPSSSVILSPTLATPSLLAHILSDKFCDGLPFHRQEC